MPLEYIDFNKHDVISCWIAPHDGREPTYLCDITPVDGPREELGEFEDIEFPAVSIMSLSSETELEWKYPRNPHEPHITFALDANLRCSLEGAKRSEGYEIYDCEVVE